HRQRDEGPSEESRLMTQTNQQIILRKKASGGGVLMLDCAGKANVISAAVMEELKGALDDLVADEHVKAIAVLSGKADTFCSGADVHEILRMQEQSEDCEMSRQGPAVFCALEKCQ